MSDHCRRHRSVVNVVFDVAVHPVDRSGEKGAQNEGEQYPVLDEDIGWQREKIEADVLVVERIVYAIWHVIEKLQEDAPVAGFCRGDQQSEQTCTARNNPGPRQSIAHEREQIRRRRTARRVPRRGGDSLHRLPPGKTHRKPSVQPKDDGGRCPDSKKDDRFGGDRRQENLQKADRGKPQPIDQEVAREPEQEQASADGNGRNCEPDHGTLPWYLPSGSGDPDRHGPMIAEMRDACRLIRSRDCASRRVIRVLEGTSNSVCERIQRIVLAAPRSEPIAEPQKLRLVDRREDRNHRGLDDLVFQGSDAEWPLFTIRLGMYWRRD